MITPERYSDYIYLNKNFKEVFNLESDVDNEDLWKRFIFTDGFKKMLQDISYIFSEERINERKGILLTGKYGVGKSHATAVLSHLLWDDFDSIHDILKRAKNRMDETGSGLYQFREEKRYFPVILTARDSGEVSDARSFEYRLQIAMESALTKAGYKDKVAEKTEFEKYSLWLKQLKNDPDREELLNLINKEVQKDSEFSGIEELVEALDDSDLGAINLITDFFKKCDLPAPRHCDTLSYYNNVLGDLKKQDPSIAGIIIYWDEFTTVFNTAGKYNDANLIERIQTWAEKADLGIYLLLVSHLSPEGLRGRYEFLGDNLAKISDRLCVTDLRMDQDTTYNLIAESLQINDPNGFSSFLTRLGFTADEYADLNTIGKNIFGETFFRDEKAIRRTIPLHIYSVCVAAKLADLVGSAERSIFSLIHSESNENTPYGQKIGFSAFLDNEPSDGKIAWYTIDQVFDYFYEDLAEHEFDALSEANVAKPLNAFKQYYEISKQIGEEGVRVYKAVVLMEMLFAKTTDPAVKPNLKNLKNAFVMTEITDVDKILQKMEEVPIIIAYKDDKTGDTIYKTLYGGYDDTERKEIKEELKKTNKFEKFIELNEANISHKIKETITDAPRVYSDNTKITVWPAADINKKKQKIEDMEYEDKLNIILCIPETHQESDHVRSELLKFSKIHRDMIFAQFEGNFAKRYDRWLNACALEALGQKRSNRAMISEASSERNTEIKKFLDELKRVKLFFRGETLTKPNGFGSEIQAYTTQIYRNGFDFLNYKELWKTPKKYSTDIAISYGKLNGRENLERNSNYFVKKAMDLFYDKRGNILIDNKLRLKEDESYTTESPLYEIVSSIQEYIRKKNGTWISIKGMIRDLGLERPPYGLCGWTESIVISYAFAEFIDERRLEIITGNQTPTKEASKIIEGLNATIKDPNKHDSQIRYGRIIENKVATKLQSIFDLDIDKKSALPDVLFKLRETINKRYHLPISIIPYSLNGPKRTGFDRLIKPLNQLIQSSDNEYSEELLNEIDRQITELELQNTGKVWKEVLSTDSAEDGFKEYIDLYFPLLNRSYPEINDLRQTIGNEIKEDPWTWQIDKISEVLAKLNRSAEPPEQIQNVHTSLSSDGLQIVWDAPATDSPQPTNYDIMRGEESETCEFIKRINADKTIFCDKTAQAGKTYYYQITALNPAGESSPSAIAKQKILPLPPQISTETQTTDNSIEISWDKPDRIYEISYYKILRGESPEVLSEIKKLPMDITSYQDYDAQPGKTNYYCVVALNSAGQTSRGIISKPTKLSPNNPPDEPLSPSVICQQKSICINWSHPQSGKDSVEEYCVYRKDQSGNIKPIHSDSPNYTSFTDKTIQPGNTYSYIITARNNAGESKWAKTESIEILPEIPQITLSVTDKEGKAHLTWEPLSEDYGIVKYELRRGENSERLNILQTLDAETSEFIDEQVRPAHMYYYKLIACNRDGATRSIDEPEKFTPRVSIDINKWEDSTLEFIKSDTDLFIQRLKAIVSKLSKEENKSLETEDLNKIVSLGDRLEEI